MSVLLEAEYCAEGKQDITIIAIQPSSETSKKGCSKRVILNAHYFILLSVSSIRALWWPHSSWRFIRIITSSAWYTREKMYLISCHISLSPESGNGEKPLIKNLFHLEIYPLLVCIKINHTVITSNPQTSKPSLQFPHTTDLQETQGTISGVAFHQLIY